MPKSAARAQPKKSSTSRPRATGLKGKKQSKSVHTINAYQAQQTNLQHEADLAALYEVGLTEEQAKELALILGCPWDLLFRWFAKTKTMRTPEVMMDTYGYKDVVTAAQAYVQKHSRPGRPYKGDKPIFGCPAKDMAAKKKVQLRDHLKAKARIAKAAKAKATKAAKPKPKQTLKSIIGKAKGKQALPKNPPGGSSPPNMDGDYIRRILAENERLKASLAQIKKVVKWTCNDKPFDLHWFSRRDVNQVLEGGEPCGSHQGVVDILKKYPKEAEKIRKGGFESNWESGFWSGVVATGRLVADVHTPDEATNAWANFPVLDS